MDTTIAALTPSPNLTQNALYHAKNIINLITSKIFIYLFCISLTFMNFLFWELHPRLLTVCLDQILKSLFDFAYCL